VPSALNIHKAPARWRPGCHTLTLKRNAPSVVARPQALMMSKPSLASET
jgi:hypothetical protein